MRIAFHFGPSHLLLFTLLCPIPRSIMPSPHSSSTLLPFEDPSELWSGFSHHQENRWLLRDTRSEGQGHPHETLLQPEKQHLQRAQREALATRLLMPPPGGLSETSHLKERRQGENGAKKNEALTSIAGGLQAVSREKGGFGFRFGRKRWTDWRLKTRRQNKWK